MLRPIDRLNLSKDPWRTECIACGGSAEASSGWPCFACQGVGSVLTTDSVEWYTPEPIIEASRELMGSIDLDPASCAMAQEIVKAAIWYGDGSEDGNDGLLQPWGGNVYLNPPGGFTEPEYHDITQSNPCLWWARLVDEWQSGDVEQALFCGFNLDILSSAQNLPDGTLQPMQFPICVSKGRIPFDTVNRVLTRGKRKGELLDPKSEEGVRVKSKSPVNAAVFIWLPPKGVRKNKVPQPTAADGKKFMNLFEQFGCCKI